MKKLLYLVIFTTLPAVTCQFPKLQEPSLHDRLGGTYAIAAVCDDFLDGFLANPIVLGNKIVAGNVDPNRLPGLLFHVTALAVEIAGGPYKYNGRTMADVHHGFNITEEEWNAVVGELKKSLDKFKVPAREQNELITAVAGTKKDIVTKPTRDKPTIPAVTGDTLYARLGGTHAIAAVCDDFLQRLLKNSVINSNTKVTDRVDPNRLPGLLFHVTALVIDVTGGPYKYAGKTMKDSHAGMDITPKEWGAMAEEFKKSLDKFRVPAGEQQELFTIIGSTMNDIVQGK